MRLCYVADARSPIARNWISYFVESGHEVHVISSYQCAADAIAGAHIYVAPLAFAKFARQPSESTDIASGPRFGATRWLRRMPLPAAGIVRDWVAPLDILPGVNKLRKLIRQIDPVFVHAMRIPFEGIAASMAIRYEYPLLISVWGNDFTLHAEHSLPTAIMTRRTMARTSAIHCDCDRDLRLSWQWGFGPQLPSLVVPTAGGIQPEIFFPGTIQDSDAAIGSLQLQGRRVVINPRGYRRYIRNDIFFKSIPYIIETHPDVLFLCPAMQGNPDAMKWVDELGLKDVVVLLPSVPRNQMADLFRAAEIVVSPSIHDGTPNSLLEALACGCFPVVSDLESVREWISDEFNGLIFNMNSAEDLAAKIRRALDEPVLRNQVKQRNLAMIENRAAYASVMSQVSKFYDRIIRTDLNTHKQSKVRS